MQWIIFPVELNNISNRKFSICFHQFSLDIPTPLVQEVGVDMAFHHQTLAAASRSSWSADSLRPYVFVVVHVSAFCVVQSGGRLLSAFGP